MSIDNFQNWMHHGEYFQFLRWTTTKKFRSHFRFFIRKCSRGRMSCMSSESFEIKNLKGANCRSYFATA